ncbi:MAG: ABC transporter ATP-binding protein [Candidatus Dojkabacteria bacterium]
MDRPFDHKKRNSLKETFQTIVWSVRLGFRVSAKFYTLKFVLRIAGTVLPVVSTYLNALIIARLVEFLGNSTQGDSSQIITLVIIQAGVLFVKSYSFEFEEYIRMRFDYKFTLKMIPIYINRMVELDMQYHDDPSFRFLQEKVEDILNWKGVAIMDRVASLTANIIGLLVLGYLFVTLNALFIVAISVPVIVHFFIDNKFGKNVYYIWEWSSEENTEAVNSYYTFKRNTTSIAEAKIYGFGNYIADRFKRIANKYISKLIKENNTKFTFMALVNALEQVVFAGIQIWLILQTLAGKLVLEGYVFYLQNIGTLSQNLNMLQSHVSKLYEFSLYMSDFRLFLEMPSKLLLSDSAVKVTQSPPSIEFKNVSFRYPAGKQDTLSNVSFKFDAGEKIALVGKNGAGKTTILKLLARFYDVTSGEILVNGVNIKELDLQSYYKLWGILFQDFAKYWFSLRENIGIGNTDDIQNMELLKAAANKASIDEDFMSKLQKGFDTMLSTEFDHGVELSGGEWQKVGIARGLFADPKLIVLDEPTSALDAIAEQKIFEEIQAIAKEATTIIVSHRFATVRNADRILVLEKGTITEQGNHEELLASSKLYHEMFTKQAKGYK